MALGWNTNFEVTRGWHTSISTSAAGEEKDLVPSGSAAVKVEAGICQCADNEHGIGLVNMLSLGDDIPALTVG
jgi:hypothetical protein